MAVLIGLILAVGVSLLVFWVVRRRLSHKEPVLLVDGTCWLFQHNELVGPCCESCRVQLMVRPLPPAAGDVALYELCCPQCRKIPVRRAFTLLELLELERVARDAWNQTKSRPQLPLPSPRPR